MKFQTDFAGTATGVRFYKASANTGTHVGALWTAGGTLLAQATFSNETASGWQHVLFSSPVTLTADTTYVVSYLAPNGHYSVTGGGFSSAIDNPPLHGLSNATSANGVYALRRLEHVPDEQLERGELRGRRDVPARSGAGHAHGRERNRRLGLGERVVDGADHGRAADVLRGSRRTSAPTPRRPRR